jgi:hypothetical protein
LSEAADDAVAAEIVAKLATEIVTMARVALTRLGLEREPVEVLLGGGMMRGAGPGLLAAIDAGLATIGPEVGSRVVGDLPVIGAALLGLDDVGAGSEAHERLRRELRAAVGGAVATIGSASDG